jgi:mRNA interferase RelE/StbE
LVWTIKYTETSQRQLKKLDRSVALCVLDYVDERIATLEDPRSQGKNLVGPKMGSYWRYRVGDVRVICHLQDQVLLILVIEMGHRREVYR